MLKRMRIRHKLDKRAELGDVVRDGEKTYVVINIIKAHVFVDANGEISAIYDCLCQRYRSENLSEEFVTTQTELPYGREGNGMKLLTSVISSMIRKPASMFRSNGLPG